MYFYKPLTPNPSQVMPMEVASELHSHKPWCVGSVRKEGRNSSSKKQSGRQGRDRKVTAGFGRDSSGSCTLPWSPQLPPGREDRAQTQ